MATHGANSHAGKENVQALINGLGLRNRGASKAPLGARVGGSSARGQARGAGAGVGVGAASSPAATLTPVGAGAAVPAAVPAVGAAAGPVPAPVPVPVPVPVPAGGAAPASAWSLFDVLSAPREVEASSRRSGEAQDGDKEAVTPQAAAERLGKVALYWPGQGSVPCLLLNLDRLGVAVGDVDGTCWRPFREYKVSVCLENRRGLQRLHTVEVRYSEARHVLHDRLASEAKRVGLHALLHRLIESFPPKRIALRDGSTGRRQGAERAHCLQRYLLKALQILEPLLEEGHAGAQALQLVIVRDFLRLDLADFAVWFKRVGQIVLGLM
jgi:hypothetical protein